MYGFLTSKEDRYTGNILKFKINENNFSREGHRAIERKDTLDGGVILTDWGYSTGKITIEINDFLLNETDYETLIAMKEDDDSDWYFHYGNESWEVAISYARGTREGDNRRCWLTLFVINKMENGLTA